LEGTPFGRYRLIEMLGRGGMGEVWRAHDTATDRTVAIKLLPAHFSDDENFHRRFRREAQAAARLNTPHVVPIHDYGEIDGRLYVNMRLIEGDDLATVLAAGPMDPARAVRIIEGVAKALHAAHEVNLLHRDVKPSNVLLDRDDFPYLIDFGIARALGETRMTKTGNTIGTFAYIAPERLGTRDEDARADIYSLTCVLYECLTGGPPFGQVTMANLVVAHLNTTPPQPSLVLPKLPAQLDRVIASGMAKNPDERYATTIELAAAARDAITAPIPSPAPVPETATPSSMPTAIAPTVPRLRRAMPPPDVDAVHTPTPAPQRPPVDVPKPRPPVDVPKPQSPVDVPKPRPFVDAPKRADPPAASTKPSVSVSVWRRKAVLIPVALAVIIVAAALGLANVGQHKAGSPSQAGAGTLLAQSAQSTRSLRSAHLVHAVNGKIQGLSIKSMTADVTRSPSVAATGHETFDVLGADVNGDLVVYDGTFYSKLNKNWKNAGRSSEFYDPTVTLNPDVGLANLLSSFSDSKVAGSETIDGIQTVKITSRVGADAVRKFLPKTTVSGAVPAVAWIRDGGSHDLVQLTLEPTSGNTLRITLSNWNSPVSVTKPPGV
jgi:serine/threonine protein kinase